MHQYEVMVILDPTVEEKTVDQSRSSSRSSLTPREQSTLFPFGEDAAWLTKSRSRPKVSTPSST
jgi:hypothetical protein